MIVRKVMKDYQGRPNCMVPLFRGGAGSLDNNECQKEAGGKEYEGEDSADH